MRTTNLNFGGERAAAIVRGHTGRGRAGSPGVTLRDSATEVIRANDITFIGATVTDGDDDTAVITIAGSPGTGTPGWFNPVDFGAAGDGITDDTAAIQAAIDEVCSSAEFGTIYFPIGIFKITATLTVSCSMRFLGASGYPGVGSVIRMTSNNTTAFSIDDSKYTTFEHLDIQNTGTNASGRGISTKGTIHFRYSRVVGFHDGLFIDGVTGNSYWSVIDEAWLTSNAAVGLYLDGKVNNVRSHRLRASGNGTHGVYASGGAEGATFDALDAENNGSSGITWDGTGSGQTADSLRIVGGWFDSNGAANISIGPTTLVQGVTVEDCFFEINAAGGENALKVNHCDRLNVIGCHFKATSGSTSILCDAANTTNVTLINVQAADTVTTPASTRILDETDVTPASTGAANAVGTSKYLARADHVHAATIASASFATPAIVLGTAAAAGAASTVIRSDSTIVAFDATVPVTQAFGDAAATGSAAVAARRDHVHGMPAAPESGAHVHVAYETHTSDGSTTTFTLDQVYEPGSVMAWNRTAGTLLGVTEVAPDQATVSAAGTAADLLDFHYAASVI